MKNIGKWKLLRNCSRLGKNLIPKALYQRPRKRRGPFAEGQDTRVRPSRCHRAMLRSAAQLLSPDGTARGSGLPPLPQVPRSPL